MRRLQLWFKLLLVLMLIAAVQADADANIGMLVRRQQDDGGNGGAKDGGGNTDGDAGGNDGGNAGNGGGKANNGGANNGGANGKNAGGNGNNGNGDGNGGNNGGNNGDNNGDNNGGNNGDNNGDNNGGNNGDNNGDNSGDNNGDNNGDGGDSGVVDGGDGGDDGGDDGDVIDGGSGDGPIRVDIKEPKQVQEVGVLVKIGSTVDIKWAYSSPPTGGKVTIEATPLIDRPGAQQQGDPVVIAANLSIRTTEYEWDTRKSRGQWLTEQLETAQYILNIYDSTLRDGETRGGRIAPFTGFRFKMYKPQRYLNFNAYVNQNPVPRVYWVGPTRWTGQLPAAAGTFAPTATIWLVTWASAIVLAYAAVLA